MGTNLDLSEALLDLSTSFETMLIEAFENPQAVGGYGMFTTLVRSSDRKLDLTTFGPGPVIREWVGEKQFKQFRAYDQEVEVKNYEKSIALDRNDLLYDTSSALQRKLSAWFATAGERDLDKLVFDALVSNSGAGPTGYDAVSLVNDSHPHMNSGSGADNKTTSALSHSTYESGKVAMQELTNEEGESMDVNPTHLMVGPKNEKMAKQIANATDRVVAVDNSGAESGTRVAAAGVENVFRGDVDVVVNRRLRGTYDDYWYLMDLSDPQALPMGFMLNRPPELVSLNRPTDKPRFYGNEEHHSIELDGATFAGAWFKLYAGIL